MKHESGSSSESEQEVKKSKKRSKKYASSDDDSSDDESSRKKKSKKKKRDATSESGSESASNSDSERRKRRSESKSKSRSVKRSASPMFDATGGSVYRALKDIDAGMEWSESPCAICPSFEFCKPGGPVNPQECVYYGDWLAGGTMANEEETAA